MSVYKWLKNNLHKGIDKSSGDENQADTDDEVENLVDLSLSSTETISRLILKFIKNINIIKIIIKLQKHVQI